MSDFINTADIIGDDTLTNNIISRTITEFNDDNTSKIGAWAFRDCTQLARVDINVSYIYEYAFYGCTSLITLVLRRTDDIVQGQGLSKILSNTPIANGTGYIYVPSALIDTYKTANGWSTYADQFRAIEDYPYISNKYDWDTIQEAISNNVYTSNYSIGDIIPLKFTGSSSYIINMQIAAFDTDDLADGTGKAPITFISKNVPNFYLPANNNFNTDTDGNSGYNVGGWKESRIRNMVNSNSVYNSIPESIRNNIKEVNKISDGGYYNQSLVTTADKIWLLSYDEVGFTDTGYTVIGQGVKYDIFSDDASRIKYTAYYSESKESSNGDWWLRSSGLSDSAAWMAVDYRGKSKLYSPAVNNYNFIAFGFCM